MADDSTGSAIGGVGAQTDDYAKQIADINTRINGLVKDATMPTGPDKDVYDGLVRQRASLSAKAKDLADKTSRAGAKAPDLDEAVGNASADPPPPPGFTVDAAMKPPASGGDPPPPPGFAVDSTFKPTSVGADDNDAEPEVPSGPTTKDTAAIVQPESKDSALGITFGGSKVTSSEVPPGPTWEEAQKTLLDLEKQGVPPTDPRYKQALKDKALGLQRLTSNGQDIALGAGIGGGAIKAAEGAGKLLKPAAKVVGRALSKAPEELAAGAERSAEALRGTTIGETGRAADKVAQDAQGQAAQAEAERALAQGKLDAATKALDADVTASRKKIEALTQQRLPAAGTKSKPFETPQFIRGKPIESEVPPRERTAPPKQRIQGLSGELDQAIRAAQQKVEDHASRLYQMGAKTAGDAPIPVAGLKETIDDFMSSLPEDIKLSVPPLIRNLQNSEAETMTVSELQTLRTTLRSLGNNPKLTPDLKSGPYRLLANKADALLHAPTNPTAVKQGVRIIDAGDKFYASNMNQFRSSTLQKIADDVRDGLPMDASKVLSTVAQSGESGTLKRLVQIGGERARVQLRNADFDNLMAAAKKPGTEQIDGAKFLKGVEDRTKSGALSTLYGKEASDLTALAKKLAAREGAIPSEEVKPGSFKLLLRRAEDLKGKVPDLAKKADAAASKATPEKIAEAKQYLGDFATQLKDTSLATEDVVGKSRTIVNKMRSDGLLTRAQHEDYLKRIKETEDLYAKSKQAAADQQKARARLKQIGTTLVLLGGGYEAFRGARTLLGH